MLVNPDKCQVLWMRMWDFRPSESVIHPKKYENLPDFDGFDVMLGTG